MQETPGTRFGNYELVRRIDIGGMGEVYLARQLTAFGRRVAVKIIRRDLVHDTTARARFLREAEVSAHLKHEHILSLFDFGEVEGRLFLVTPYIEGGTLAARLQASGPLSLVEAHHLFVPLAQAVAYIHRRGVIHRDLKPTNIMLDSEDGEVYVRLIDFGIATMQGHSASPPLTAAGHEMGTVAYMAPERLAGIAAPSNDIFSLGVILHQMLTGRMPTAAPPSPDARGPRLAEPLARVVRQAIAAHPNARYASVEAFLKDFEEAYQQIVSPIPAAAQAVAVGLGSTATAVTASLEGEQTIISEHPELVSLAHSGEVSALATQVPVQGQGYPSTPSGSSFTSEDYNAPTTSFQNFPQPPQGRSMPNSRPPLLRPPQPQPPRSSQPPRTRRRSSLFLLISAATVIVLVVLASMLYYGYQVVDAPNVSINFAPQARAISQVITLKADPQVHTVDPVNARIPEFPLTISQSTQQTGDTTGQVDCTFLGFGCQRAVSQNDVDNLVAQMQPGLGQAITRQLKSQIAAKRGIQVGTVNFFNQSVTANPPVNTRSKTVTVTLTEQGSVGYFLQQDATQVAHQALVTTSAQFGQGYQLVDSTIHISAFAIQNIDQASGVCTVAVSEGAVALYQFTPAILQTIANGLVGKSLAAARQFLESQPGIDPASIGIHFTAGNGQNMPGDFQHIKLIPTNPSSLPNVSLTPVPGITPEPTSTTPTPTATPTGSGN